MEENHENEQSERFKTEKNDFEKQLKKDENTDAAAGATNTTIRGPCTGPSNCVDAEPRPSSLEAALASRSDESRNTVIKRTVITMDTLLDKLHCPGSSQIFIYILLCLNVFPVSLNFMAMSIFGASPNQTCHIPNDWPNRTFAIPFTKGGKLEKCIMYQATNETLLKSTEKCTYGYEYHLSDGKYPITAEWDLVCENAYLIRTAQSIFFVGVMLGGLIFGFLGDEFGRRPITLITLYSQALLGVAVAFSNSFIMFTVLKFFQGMMLQGLQTSNNTMAMELFQTRYRTIAGMIVAILATANSMIIGIISYLVPNWRQMQLVISVPTIITVMFLWLLPESLRWLLSKQKLDGAVSVAKLYAKRNKVKVPEDLRTNMELLAQQISTNAAQSVKSNVMDLMKISAVRRTSFILFFSWFTASVVYYGITFTIPDLSGNASLNFFIVGALESISRFIGYFIIKRFGRRIPLSISFILSGILCAVSVGIGKFLQDKDHNLSIITTAMALLGRASMGQCFAFLLIVTSEVFPTVLRTAGSGACSVWTRIGGIIAPQTLLLDKYVGTATPFIVFGALAIIAGCLTLIIPETLNIPLPDTVKDTQKFHTMHTIHSPINHGGTVNYGLETDDGNVSKNNVPTMKNENGYNKKSQNSVLTSVSTNDSTKL